MSTLIHPWPTEERVVKIVKGNAGNMKVQNREKRRMGEMKSEKKRKKERQCKIGRKFVSRSSFLSESNC